MPSAAKGKMLPRSCIAKCQFGVFCFFFFKSPRAPDPVSPHLKGSASPGSPPREPLPGGPRGLGFWDAGTAWEGDPPEGRRQGPRGSPARGSEERIRGARWLSVAECRVGRGACRYIELSYVNEVMSPAGLLNSFASPAPCPTA